MLDCNQCEISSITNKMLDLAPWIFHCFSPSSGTYLLMVFESDCEPSHHHRELDKHVKQQKCWKGKVAL